MSSFEEKLGEVLDAHDGGSGAVEVATGGASAEVDVVASGPIGVRLRGVKVHRSRDVAIAPEAEALPQRLRALPEKIVPTEVDPGLGGAILRTAPEHMREREFFQVDLSGPRDAQVRRYKGGPDGRKAVDWDMTREQLGRLLDQLEGGDEDEP